MSTYIMSCRYWIQRKISIKVSTNLSSIISCFSTETVHLRFLTFEVCFKMTFFDNSEWIGYLAENIIRRCISLAETECPGCRDSVKCSILHLHHQLSLLDKIQNHFEAVRGEVLHKLQNLYADIQHRLPHSTDEKKDKTIYCNVGRIFLLTCSPQSIYFGRYVNEMNDSFLCEVFEESKGTSRAKRSRK